MSSGKQTKSTQTRPNRVCSFVRNLSVYKLQKLLFVFLYINPNSPQKSRFYLIIIINHGGVCYCMNGMMRPHDSYVSICKTICPLFKKKVLFVFMFPFRIMVLTRKNNFHTTHTTIYYRRMYVKFLRHKVIMT